MKKHNVNVDKAEIQKFDDLAHEWWDPRGPMRPLHQLNPCRLSFIQQHFNLQEKMVLDVGCGGGILTESLALHGANAIGLDLSPEVIKVAEEHARTNQLTIEYFQENIETFAEKHPQKFDAISCMEMLEHVPEPLLILKACAQLLKPNGLLFLSTLNRTPKSFLMAIVGAEYLLKILPKGTHHYSKFIRPSELTASARLAGFELVDLQGLEYHPLSGKFDLGKSLSVNYVACFKKNEN